MNVVQILVGLVVMGLRAVLVGIGYAFSFVGFLFASASDLLDKLLVSVMGDVN